MELILIHQDHARRLTEPELDKVIDLIYYCESCSTATVDIFHLKFAEEWSDITKALGA